MKPQIDPRESITPDAFSVATELLGTPLARPWRRAAAMAVDLLAISILARAGGLFLGLAAAFVLLRLALRSRGGPFGRRSRQAVFGCAGVTVLAVTFAAGWLSWTGGGRSSFNVGADSDAGSAPFGELGAIMAEVTSLRGSSSEGEAREAATRFAERLIREGSDSVEAAGIVAFLLDTVAKPWAQDMVDSILTPAGELTPAVELDSDSLARAYASALETGDTAAVTTLRASLREALAGDMTRRMERRIDNLEDRNSELLRERDEFKERGLIRWLINIADEVGIGVGWSGIYFTFFTAVLRGFTPGKRLFKIRVVRLDGKAIGWWTAFNRFGGYAASVFTGLLGFFEMFWDPNRQALQDRIAATVVIRI